MDVIRPLTQSTRNALSDTETATRGAIQATSRRDNMKQGARSTQSTRIGSVHGTESSTNEPRIFSEEPLESATGGISSGSWKKILGALRMEPSLRPEPIRALRVFRVQSVPSVRDARHRPASTPPVDRLVSRSPRRPSSSVHQN